MYDSLITWDLNPCHNHLQSCYFVVPKLRDSVGWSALKCAVWPLHLYGDCSLRVSCPILLNFLFVLMPGRNLRDLVAAICNVVFGNHSYFVVFVCQFIWCFMCLQHFWWLPFEAPVLCLYIKLILVGHWGHFYFGFLPLCFSCVFSDKGRISPEFEPVAH